MAAKVLVIGASGDIGFAISQRLAQEGYGVLGLDQKPSRSKVFDKFYRVDIRDDAETKAVCCRICDEYEGLWGVVFSAGVYPITDFDDYSLTLWDDVHAVNLRSVFHISQLIHPHIAKGGRIVVIGSGASHIGSRDVGYSTSKAGVIGLVRSLSRVLARHEIFVNAVCPGVIDTQMSKRMSTEHIGEYLNTLPTSRLGTADEVAICVSFLLNSSNSYMTGATIDVNGGLYSR